MTSTIRTLLVACTLPLLINCASAPPRAERTPRRANAWIQETLYFGRDIPGQSRTDSAVVTDAQWRRFEEETLIPSLGGYTVLDAFGTYHDTRLGVVREPTKVVVYAHPDTGSRALDAAIARYIELFHQRAVGRVTSPVIAASF
jgi:hypothetical protein